jgi:hypothetical protein
MDTEVEANSVHDYTKYTITMKRTHAISMCMAMALNGIYKIGTNGIYCLNYSTYWIYL